MLLISERIDDAHKDSDTERRRGLRIRQNRPVKIFEPVASRYFAGQTCDISNTGLRLELPAFAPLLPGKLLNIHVGVPDGRSALADRRQMIPARVVWVDRVTERKGKRMLFAGVEFLSSMAAHLDAA